MYDGSRLRVAHGRFLAEDWRFAVLVGAILGIALLCGGGGLWWLARRYPPARRPAQWVATIVFLLVFFATHSRRGDDAVDQLGAVTYIVAYAPPFAAVLIYVFIRWWTKAPVAEPVRVMRWFPHAWHVGDWEDSDWEAANASYDAHLHQLRAQVPERVWALTELSLHDGQVQSWSIDQGVFKWILLIGDLERGYELAEVTYTDAELIGPDSESLRGMSLDQEPTELLTDEVDIGNGKYEHRFYFWPGHEFGVRFTDVRVSRSPASAEFRR